MDKVLLKRRMFNICKSLKELITKKRKAQKLTSKVYITFDLSIETIVFTLSQLLLLEYSLYDLLKKLISN
jgi:hypothetical protein